MNERLQEYVDSRGLPIHADRQRGVIRGVKILGVRSQNGRTYLAEAIGQAVPLYEGAKVNVNHAKEAPSGPRDYQDRIGVIRNVAVRADEGLFGDFHFNPKHALAEYEPARNETGGPWTQRVFNESFVETLVGAEDEATVRKLIRERVELARDILGNQRAARPLSREQTQLHNQPPIDAKSFARSIS